MQPGGVMVARTFTVAFEGAEARLVEVQCALSPGLPGFAVVGLPDKAVNEARDRVRSALGALGVALPMQRITVNLSPADLPKIGSHFDLPIALCLLAAIGVLPPERVEAVMSLGELSLDGRLLPVAGALPAAVAAAAAEVELICPAESGAEAAWVPAARVAAGATLDALIAHLSGRMPLPEIRPGLVAASASGGDLRDVRGQMRAKRALEIAAAGGHHLLMVGPPGAGKSMLAARLPGLLPEATAREALETSMIHSVAGLLGPGGITRARPFREPHHTASVAAMAGGGRGALPGEISLAHNGVLFLDELPEFPRAVLEVLRQPLETGSVTVARANSHVSYPSRFQLIAAANPCRCGHAGDAERTCSSAPDCGAKYLGRISGPLLDRFDLRFEVPPVPWADLAEAPAGEASATVAARVATARARQAQRYAALGEGRANAEVPGAALDQAVDLDAEGRGLLGRAAERLGLSARGCHRVLRTARTIADLAGSASVRAPHLAEALSFRLPVGAAG